MTDREKLIEFLTDDDCPLLYMQGEVGNLADYLIANGVTVQKWIPVTERLPDVWKEVITHRTGGDLSIEFRCSGEGWSFDNDIMGEVTHWMPLPEAPKEDEQ